jgi:NAD(P)-dependent dehydrogenase (short-subunit alcohol dehydrogenase family)
MVIRRFERSCRKQTSAKTPQAKRGAKTAALKAAERGVTVNVILPGPVDKPMMDNPIRCRQAVPDKASPTCQDDLEARKMRRRWVMPG